MVVCWMHQLGMKYSILTPFLWARHNFFYRYPCLARSDLAGNTMRRKLSRKRSKKKAWYDNHCCEVNNNLMSGIYHGHTKCENRTYTHTKNKFDQIYDTKTMDKVATNRMLWNAVTVPQWDYFGACTNGMNESPTNSKFQRAFQVL